MPACVAAVVGKDKVSQLVVVVIAVQVVHDTVESAVAFDLIGTEVARPRRRLGRMEE